MEFSFDISLADVRLAPGRYTLSVSVGEGTLTESRREFDVVRNATAFDVSEVRNAGGSPIAWSRAYGYLYHPTDHCAINDAKGAL